MENGNGHVPKAHRDAFYHDVAKQTGLTINQIREHLAAHYDQYQIEMEPEYRQRLKLYAQLFSSLEKTKPVLTYCPVCNAPTNIVFRWGWECTKGGLRHKIVDTISRASGIDSQKLLAKLEELDAAYHKTSSNESPCQT